MTDAESIEQIPPWASSAHAVAVAERAVLVRVRHEDEGDVSVRMIQDESQARGDEIFDGVLLVQSGAVRISDAQGEQGVDCLTAPGSHRLRVYSDEPLEGTAIDVLLD